MPVHNLMRTDKLNNLQASLYTCREVCFITSRTGSVIKRSIDVSL